jgi:hypothetical protein
MDIVVSWMEGAIANLAANFRALVWGWHYAMVRDMILNGPAFAIAGVELGGYEGKNHADICASRGRHSALFWAEPQNFGECTKSIDDMVFSRAMFFWWPMWLLIIWYQVLPHVPTFLAWTFKPRAPSGQAALGGAPPAPPPAGGRPGRQWDDDRRRREMLRRMAIQDKIAAFDLLVPFLQNLTNFYERDGRRAIGEFLAINPIPVDRARLLLPPLPAPAPAHAPRARAGSDEAAGEAIEN